MASNNLVLALISLSLHLFCSSAQTLIKVGAVDVSASTPDIDSTLFTHLVCFFNLNSSSYQISLTSTDEQYFSSFINTVKRKNPSVVTLLSFCNEPANASALSLMLNQSSYRKSFMKSSIKIAIKYGFQGIDLCWLRYINTATDMTNAGVVLDEWRAEVDSESRNSSGPAQLILSMPLHYSPTSELGSVLPVESIRRNVDWGLLLPYNYHVITKENITLANAPLYDPASDVNTDYGVREWLAKGFPANKLIFGITYYAFVWKLVNPADNYIGAPSLGIIDAVGYNELKLINQTYGVKTIFNATYVVNQCVIQSNWICFDDVDAVRIKIAYAKEKKLLGYFVHPINYDENWVLSRAAASTAHEGEESGQEHNLHKPRLFLIIILPVALVIILLAITICYKYRRVLKLKGMIRFRKGGLSGPVANPSAAEHLGSNVPHLRVFSFSSIKAATNDFSSENELGKGGFGPVYEGKLPRGQHIAVKRLSKTSTQGHTEFTNEVTLTARLQHRNLVRVLGYCIEREEKMLIYEYMPNRSLDFLLYDPIKRNILEWGKLVHIIEGVIQGLLYLQEYSNFTIIHRDLKASNILLDKDMNPKISDFGMAKLFGKDEHEANTDKIVGTYGYVPPEYVRKGIYSMKYDVYSFGVLLLQIISGKRNGFHYGANENLSLLEYAYELWKEGGGNQFIDPSLNDSSSPCKLLRCLQVALLCIQEYPVDRPTMLGIYSMLRNDSELIATPKRPAFSTISDENVGSKQGSSSVNSTIITEILAR